MMRCVSPDYSVSPKPKMQALSLIIIHHDFPVHSCIMLFSTILYWFMVTSKNHQGKPYFLSRQCLITTSLFYSMNEQQSKDPLHGITLEQILTHLVADYGWEKLGKYIKVRCFTSDPSIKSSLKFLRKTPWAREKVEKLYITSLKSNK